MNGMLSRPTNHLRTEKEQGEVGIAPASPFPLHRFAVLVSCVFSVLLFFPRRQFCLSFRTVIVLLDYRQQTAGDALNGIIGNLHATARLSAEFNHVFAFSPFRDLSPLYFEKKMQPHNKPLASFASAWCLVTYVYVNIIIKKPQYVKLFYSLCIYCFANSLKKTTILW